MKFIWLQMGSPVCSRCAALLHPDNDIISWRTVSSICCAIAVTLPCDCHSCFRAMSQLRLRENSSVLLWFVHDPKCLTNSKFDLLMALHERRNGQESEDSSSCGDHECLQKFMTVYPTECVGQTDTVLSNCYDMAKSTKPVLVWQM